MYNILRTVRSSVSLATEVNLSIFRILLFPIVLLCYGIFNPLSTLGLKVARRLLKRPQRSLSAVLQWLFSWPIAIPALAIGVLCYPISRVTSRLVWSMSGWQGEVTETGLRLRSALRSTQFEIPWSDVRSAELIQGPFLCFQVMLNSGEALDVEVANLPAFRQAFAHQKKVLQEVQEN
jgi:hypothetical protein